MNPRAKHKILVVDDEDIVRDALVQWLSTLGYTVLAATNGYEALAVIKKEKVAVLVADLIMPGMNGVELLRHAKRIVPTLSAIIITAYANVPTAIEAMRAGAYDYVEKPFCPEKVELLVKKLIEHQQLIAENVSLRRKVEDKYRLENLIAKSDKMIKVFDLIRTVAPSTATILISGESGTGKELVARAIHSLSGRKTKPFVATSCAALPESLLESELFGHERGAFTGAVARKRGKFELAHGGTLFLDEIGEINANVQVHLLRVLEEKKVTRLGGEEEVTVDVRIVAATNKDLKSKVSEGTFRDDLYYRLNVVSVHLPPLRERTSDIPFLAEHFLLRYSEQNKKNVSSFSREAMQAFMKHEWPGNVRELENAIERGVVLCNGDTVEVTDIPPDIISGPLSAERDIESVTRAHILRTLDQANGNVSKAAQILGMQRSTLYNKLKKYKAISPT